MIYRINIIALLLVLIFNCNAQQKETIHGVVTDINGTPIDNVNIKLINSSVGTKTNAKGEFSLMVIDLPCELYFSHLAYNELNIEVSSSSFISIQLSEKSYMLGEISINESLRLTSKFEYISDYEIYEDKLLYIGMRGGNPHKSYLVIADFMGNVKTKIKVHGKSDIFKDCVGVCHVLQKDTAFQIHFDGQKIHLLYPVSNKEFLNQFNNCAGVSNGNFIFKQYYNNFQTLYYYFIDAETGKINDMWMHKADDLGRDEYLTTGNNASLITTESEDRFYNEIMKQPIYSPLFKAKDEILVFNLFGVNSPPLAAKVISLLHGGKQVYSQVT